VSLSVEATCANAGFPAGRAAPTTAATPAVIACFLCGQKCEGLMLISRHAHQADTGDLSSRIKAEQQAGCITAWKDQLHNIECLITAVLFSSTCALFARTP
jgi:hypothetical protein